MSGLETHNLAIGYARRRIADGLNLTLRPGEILCLLGPNGIGKSTLFRTLLGLQPALAGSVQVQGDTLAMLNPRHLAQRIAYVPQAQSGSFPFTLFDMVLMGRTAHRGLFAAPSRHDHGIAAGALQRLGISALADTIYTRLSGGERQLGLIARALAAEAPLMLLDEPTANLDFGNQARVLAELRGLADSGIGILFTTHDPDQALAHADRVLLLGPAGFQMQGRPRETLTAENLHHLYGINVALADVALPHGSSRRICLPLPERHETA